MSSTLESPSAVSMIGSMPIRRAMPVARSIWPSRASTRWMSAATAAFGSTTLSSRSPACSTTSIRSRYIQWVSIPLMRTETDPPSPRQSTSRSPAITAARARSLSSGAGVLEVQEHAVGVARGRLGERVGAHAGNGEHAAPQPSRNSPPSIRRFSGTASACQARSPQRETPQSTNRRADGRGPASTGESSCAGPGPSRGGGPRGSRMATWPFPRRPIGTGPAAAPGAARAHGAGPPPDPRKRRLLRGAPGGQRGLLRGPSAGHRAGGERAGRAAHDRWARRHGIPITARSGGHSYAGYSTTTGVVLTWGTSTRCGSWARGLAQVGAGTPLVDLYATLAAKGLTVPGGSCPTVGVGAWPRAAAWGWPRDGTARPRTTSSRSRWSRPTAAS